MTYGALSQSTSAAFVGAYDAIPNIVAAYGMRRLLSSYESNLIRIRRSSDNAEQDFGYDANGDLDVAGIATFVGGGSGFVATWYDQSGNANNATQATAGSQPLYVASGWNSKPVPRFDGSDDHLSMGAFGLGISSFSALALAARAATNHAITPFGGRSSGSNADNWQMEMPSNFQGGNFLRSIFYSVINDFTDLAPGTELLVEVIRASNDVIRGFLDGVESASSFAVGSDTATDVVRYIGALNSGGSAVSLTKGDLLEIVIADAAWSTANRQAAETAANDYWAVF